MTRSRAAWDLARTQQGVVARRQLLALGFSTKAIEHRVRTGRLRRLRSGVYAIGRLELGEKGRWMAAILACGEGAFLTHRSAGALYGICAEAPGRIEIGTRRGAGREPDGIRLRRRAALGGPEVGKAKGIPVTSPVQTLIDLATVQGPETLLRSINEADKLDVIDPEELRRGIERRSRQPGVPALRRLLDRDTFVLSDEELERRFLPLAREVGLPLPRTKEVVNGFEVDFYWPRLGLVVETDGWRYHRTPSAQARDALRFQRHVAAGLTPLRFSHHQVKYEPGHVREILKGTMKHLVHL